MEGEGSRRVCLRGGDIGPLFPFGLQFNCVHMYVTLLHVATTDLMGD